MYAVIFVAAYGDRQNSIASERLVVWLLVLRGSRSMSRELQSRTRLQQRVPR